MQIPDYSSVCLDLMEPSLKYQPLLSKKALSSLTSGWHLDGDRNLASFLQANHQWSVLTHGLSVANTLELTSSVLRAQHMIGHWIWWAFLRSEVPQHVQHCLQHSTAPISTSPWVSKLVAHIYKCYSLPRGNQPVLVPFADVFPEISTGVLDLKVASLGRLGYIMEEEEEELLIGHTCQIIVQWIGMPCAQQDTNRNLPSYAWDTRGWFIDSILSLKHPGLLLLSEFYKVFNSSRLPTLTYQNADRITQQLQSTFLTNNNNLSSALHLDHIFNTFLPPNSSMIPLSCEPLVAPQPFIPSPAPIATGTNVQLSNMDIPPTIEAAGDAIVQFLLDIQGVNSSSPQAPFMSAITEDAWVSHTVSKIEHVIYN